MEHREAQEATATAAGDAEIIDVEEAIARYEGEWVLMHIMESDENWEPVRGVVLAHSRSRDDMSVVLARQPLRSTLPPDAPYRPYYTFNAFPRLRPGETEEQGRVRYAVQRAAALERRRG